MPAKPKRSVSHYVGCAQLVEQIRSNMKNHWQMKWLTLIMTIVECSNGEPWVDVFLWIFYDPPKPGFRQSKPPSCQHRLHGSEFLRHLSCSSLRFWSEAFRYTPSTFAPVLWAVAGRALCVVVAHTVLLGDQCDWGLMVGVSSDEFVVASDRCMCAWENI